MQLVGAHGQHEQQPAGRWSARRAARAGRASRGPPTARPRTRASAARARTAAPITPSISSSSRDGVAFARRALPAGHPRARVPGVRSRRARRRARRPAPPRAARPPAARIISTTGANGIPPPSSSTQPPTSTRVPAPRASPISSWTSLDLPTPASPPTTTVTCSPARTRSRALAQRPQLRLAPHQDGAHETSRHARYHDARSASRKKARRVCRAGPGAADTVRPEPAGYSAQVSRATMEVGMSRKAGFRAGVLAVALTVALVD